MDIIEKIKLRLWGMVDEPIDTYNDYTFQHSYGQRRFALKLLNFIKNLEEEHQEQLECERLKVKRNPTIELEFNKDLFKNDYVQIYIEDKVINIEGKILDYILDSTVGKPVKETFVIKNVSDEQVEYLKKHLNEVVKPTNIKENGKELFIDIENSINYKRLKAILLYKNSIYRINSIMIIEKENKTKSIVAGIV